VVPLVLDRRPLAFQSSGWDGRQLVAQTAFVALPDGADSEVRFAGPEAAGNEGRGARWVALWLHDLDESHAPIMPEVHS
jgi:hypothetical protein